MKKAIIILMIGVLLTGLTSCLGMQARMDPGEGPEADSKLLRAITLGGALDLGREAIAEGADIDRFGGSLGDASSLMGRVKNPFKYAYDNGHRRFAEALLEWGANPNIIDEHGWPIMASVISSDDIDMCRLMIEKGADANLKGKLDKTPLDACFFLGGASAERMFDFLVENGAEVTPETLAHAMTGDGNEETRYRDSGRIRDIIKGLTTGNNEAVAETMGEFYDNYTCYSLVRKIVKHLDAEGQPIEIDPLIKAILLGDEDDALLLLGKKTGRDKRCLYFASAFGTPKILEALIREGRELTETDLNDASLLAIAAKCGNTTMLEYLIPKYDVRGNDGFDALKLAVMYDQINAAKMLMADKAPLIRTKSTSSYNELLPYACMNGSTDLVGILIENGDTRYATAVNIACQYNQTSCLKLLLAAGANVQKSCDLQGRSHQPISVAARYGSMECVVLLMQKGADINGRGDFQSPLAEACRNGRIEAAEYLIGQGADVNYYPKDDDSRLPLFAAIAAGDLDMIKLLVENGAIVTDGLLSFAKGNIQIEENYQYLLSARQNEDND